MNFNFIFINLKLIWINRLLVVCLVKSVFVKISHDISHKMLKHPTSHNKQYTPHRILHRSMLSISLCHLVRSLLLSSLNDHSL